MFYVGAAAGWPGCEWERQGAEGKGSELTHPRGAVGGGVIQGRTRVLPTQPESPLLP